jgi:pantothenate kinase-related protein Tda10
LNEGKGDRVEPDKFKNVDGPIDIVIVEGWMLGY